MLGGVSYPSFYYPDEILGWSHRPGAEGWRRLEGEAYIRINSDGLRDREHSSQKPANTLRIAVLGDSYAEAFQVPLEVTFWAVMEQELDGCKALRGNKVEVINYGVSGYGTAQELLALRHRAWDYSPDIVLLAFFAGNDILDNSRELVSHSTRPYFEYRGNELVLDEQFIDSPGYQNRQTWLAQLGYWLIDHSRTLQLVNRGKNLLGFIFDERRELGFIHNDAMGESGLDPRIYLEPVDPAWEAAWQVTEGLIVLMRDEVTQEGASFFVATASSPIQVHPDPSVREEFMRLAGVDDLSYSDTRIKEMGEREDILVLNLASAFRAYAEENQIFLHGFENTAMGEGHWNAKGHYLAGQMIAQQICENISADLGMD